jgi:light-regulated signal transduction histidine kinase (bacteriophytochrome)
VAICSDITKRTQAEEEIKKLNEELKRRTIELEAANKELETFSAAAAHDLRTPLIVIGALSQKIFKCYFDKLDAKGRDYLQQLLLNTRKMEQLIEDLLKLSYVTRAGIKHETLDLSEFAKSILVELQKNDPARQVEFMVAEGLLAEGDPRLLRLMLENLLRNAWKFTIKCQRPCIEVGAIPIGDKLTYFIRDNGCGFDMTYMDRLFKPFHRLHTSEEFTGTGIGLATVKRIIDRHGGRIWAESAVEKGTTFFFTLE